MLIHEAKLKNCPFCRGKSKMHLYLGKYYVTCKKCKSYSAPYDTVEEAEAAWNRRDGVDENELERQS